MSTAWAALRVGDSPSAVSHRVQRAHEHFLAGWPTSGLPGSSSPDVRPVVAQSWVRSRAGGVDPHHPGARARVMAATWMPLEVCQDPDDVAGATGGALVHLTRVVTSPAVVLTA